MKSKDELGDAMKGYESLEAGRKAIPRVPMLARLDGRAFHTFTRGLDRPFDSRFQACMREAATSLVASFNATVGYTQSHEITLLFPEPQNLFDGRFQKYHSVLAGLASAAFYKALVKHLPEKTERGPVPCFDCRVWQVPSLDTALDVFLWREQDAAKNSVSMAARAYYSHKQILNQGTAQMLRMLKECGVSWNQYPAHFRWGQYVKRVAYLKTLTDEEWNRIPPAQRAELKGRTVQRTEARAVELSHRLADTTRERAAMFLLATSCDDTTERFLFGTQEGK